MLTDSGADFFSNHHPQPPQAEPNTTSRLSGFCRTTGAISRASGATTNYLPPARLQADDRRQSQRASLRGVIAPLFASFAEEERQERTCVRDWSAVDRKARETKRERPVKQKKKKAGVMLSGNTTYNKPEDGPE